MALSTRIIKGKMKSIKGIGKTTKAMEMVSSSKMRKATSKAMLTRSYADTALNMLTNIAQDRFTSHALMKEGKGSGELVVIVASSRGMCGGYNTNVYRRLTKLMSENAELKYAVTVGSYGERIARKAGLLIKASFIDMPEDASAVDSMPVWNVVRDEFMNGSSKVHLLYTRYNSALSQKAVVRQLLPISADTLRDSFESLGSDEQQEDVRGHSLRSYDFEPNMEEVLDYILPRLASMQIYYCLAESKASEHSARMVAMKNASESASGMLDDLNLLYNNARQAGITREISEIAAGADALGG